MKILFSISRFAQGGLEGVAITYANGLANKGHDVTIMALNSSLSYGLERIDPKVNVLYLDVKSAKRSALRLYKLLKEYRLDMVLCFNPEISFYFCLLSRLFGFKYSVRVNNSQSAYDKKGFFIKYLLKPLVNYSLRKSDFIIAQCNSMKLELMESLKGLGKEQVQVIYNPSKYYLNENNYEEHVKRNMNDSINYIYIGRLIEQKNVLFLADIANEYFKNYCLRDTVFHIVGDGPLRDQLKLKLKSLNLLEHFEFHGIVNEPENLIAQSDALLLCSIHEGFPNVLVESISLATPVVSINCPTGPSEIVIDGKNGYLINDYNPVLFAKSLSQIVKSPLDGKQILASSRKFSKEDAIEKLNCLIRSS